MRWNLLKNVHGFWSWMAMPLGNSLQFCWKFHAFPMQFFCSHNSKIWSFHIGSNFSCIHLIYFKILPIEWMTHFLFLLFKPLYFCSPHDVFFWWGFSWKFPFPISFQPDFSSTALLTETNLLNWLPYVIHLSVFVLLKCFMSLCWSNIFLIVLLYSLSVPLSHCLLSSLLQDWCILEGRCCFAFCIVFVSALELLCLALVLADFFLSFLHFSFSLLSSF